MHAKWYVANEYIQIALNILIFIMYSKYSKMILVHLVPHEEAVIHFKSVSSVEIKKERSQGMLHGGIRNVHT